MSLNDEERKTMVGLQLEKAYRFMEQAEMVRGLQQWDLSANRYYYACYHIVHAVFIKQGIATKTHDGTLTELGKHFILTGRLDKKYGRFYARMIQLRIKADYNSIAEVTEAEVLEMSPLSHEFVAALEVLINQDVVEP
jgi:uncharacterized protein (UPF0332 family)